MYVKYSSDFTSNDNGWGSFDDVTETGAVDGYLGGLDGNLRLATGSAYWSNIGVV
jgi:phage head maturation protease